MIHRVRRWTMGAKMSEIFNAAVIAAL